MKNIQLKLNEEPIYILTKAIKNATPVVEVTSKRVGGATYQVPTEVSKERGISLALRFLVKSARNRPGKTMTLKLENEIIDAYNNTGNSVKKKKKFIKQQKLTKLSQQ